MMMLSRLLLSLYCLNSACAFHVISRSNLDQLALRANLKQALHRLEENDLESPSYMEKCKVVCNNDEIVGVTRRTAVMTGASLLCCAFVPKDVYAIKNGTGDRSNPSPNALLPTSDGKSISMPLIAYSFYKTSPEQSPRGLALALRAGVRHFDMSTDYGNFDEIAPIFKQYWNTGKIAWKFEDEKEELLQMLDATKKAAGETKRKKMQGKKERRQDTFLTYKLSNSEQSTDTSSIRNKIVSLLSKLDTPYLDLVCIHSPLTGSELRIATYKTLVQLKDEGLICCVGVCNYGLCHLKEISSNGLPLPAVNQLEISPFNTHEAIVKFCKENSVQIACASWSKLSSVSGPVEQWAKLGELSKDKGVTKAQVLVRWALQKGFGCAPRSGTGSKLERVAIAENSYGGVVNFELSSEDMKLLDSLDVNYKTGKLGRRDGWRDEDVSSEEWDPTDAAC